MDKHVLAAAVWRDEPKPFVVLNHLTVPVAMFPPPYVAQGAL
jgi:hypothetical protein